MPLFRRRKNQPETEPDPPAAEVVAGKDSSSELPTDQGKPDEKTEAVEHSDAAEEAESTDPSPADDQSDATADPIPPQLGPNGMRSVADHRDFLLSAVEELPPFGQQLLDAVGLRLGQRVVSPIDLPGFDNSAMDGYAVIASDTAEASDQKPTVLVVVGSLAAGDQAQRRVLPGTAIKIMTGAPMPEGADAVVAYEDTDRGSDEVLIYVPSKPGRHIRRQGEDLSADTELFDEGKLLDAPAIGLLAAIGTSKVQVRPRPRVVVLATGSELVTPGNRLPAGKLYDSNSYLLAAAAQAAGAQVFRADPVSDDAKKIKQVINDQLIRADLIITSGGVSQGDHDVVKQVMPELGWTDFTTVAMQPGKPQGFGLIGPNRVPMIMVPGNPVSAFISFEVFIRPVIAKLMGADPMQRDERLIPTQGEITSLAGKQQFARGIVSEDSAGEPKVRLVGGHGSHLVGELAQANCLIVLDEQTESVGVGELVKVWMLGEIPA